MPDLETLRIIWWGLMGVLLIGFAITDGFDFGVATLFLFISRTETEKRIILNSIGPIWEGNQVWIILGAGAIFAAWPYVYAAAFSGFYFLILLLLLTMGISRPVSFKYRSKLINPVWRHSWDIAVFIGGIVPALLFGILVGNVLRGIPFYFDTNLRFFYTDSLKDLFSPFIWLCGLTSLTMLMMHGAAYLTIKTEAPLRDRAQLWARVLSLLFVLLFAMGGIWVAYKLPGYEITSTVNPNGFSNPLNKQVSSHIGAWMLNYTRYPLTILAPILGFVGALLVSLTISWRSGLFAFLCSSLSIAGVISTVGLSMFPFILPSSSSMSASL